MNINDFPTDLLEEIFLRFVSQSQQSSQSLPSICPHSPANLTIISIVCRRWRDITLNLAPLWNHLHVVGPQQLSIVNDLQVWMQRARRLPLCLSLHQLHYYDLHATVTVAVIIFFLNSLNHCKSFELFLLSDLNPFPLGSIETSPSISLESVNVCCSHWSESKVSDIDLLTNLLLNTPSLRTIRWSCQWSHPLLIPQSWENLHELVTDNVGSLAEFLNALTQCQNLERLEILGVPEISGTPDFIPQLSLPRVTHLFVVLGISSKRMLSLLIFQSLVDLEVVLSFRSSTLDPVLDMIQVSGVILRRLKVVNRVVPTRYGRLTQERLILALKKPYLQELRVLEIEEPKMDGHGILKFLTLKNTAADGGDENSGYLVCLERICLVFRDTQRGLLQDLIKSRPPSIQIMLSDRETACVQSTES